MSTHHVPPQAKTPVFQGIIKKNASVPFIFLSDDNLVKLSPLCRVPNIKEEIDKLISAGDKERLDTFINTVFDNPRIIYIDGIAYAINTIMPTNVIDNRLETEVAKRIQARDAQNVDTDTKELLHHVTLLLHSRQKKDDDEDMITALDYAREGISFAIGKSKSSSAGIEKTGVFAMKYVKSYRIRYQSTDTDAKEKHRKSGVWEFPECVIATQIIKVSCEGSWKIGFTRSAVILYPNNYQNMYVFSGNGICTGPMAGSDTEKRIFSLDFISGVYYFLQQVEFIVTRGYHERSSPANGHIFDTKYDQYRVRLNGNVLTTCSTCEKSDRCTSTCEPITIDQEKRMWIEFKKHEAEADIGGSLEATRNVSKKIRNR